jgi:predicted small integral membrane protein
MPEILQHPISPYLSFDVMTDLVELRLLIEALLASSTLGPSSTALLRFLLHRQSRESLRGRLLVALMKSRFIKVASGGLDSSFLWLNVAAPYGREEGRAAVQCR